MNKDNYKLYYTHTNTHLKVAYAFSNAEANQTHWLRLKFDCVWKYIPSNIYLQVHKILFNIDVYVNGHR